MTEKTDNTKHDDEQIDWHLAFNQRLTNIEKDRSETDRNYAEIRKTNSIIDKNKVDINKVLSDMDRNKTDVDKALSDIKLSDKKSRWYELTLVIAIFSAAAVFIGAVITLTKLYL